MDSSSDALSLFLGIDTDSEPDFIPWLRTLSVVKKRFFDGVVHISAIEPLSGKLFDLYHGVGESGPFLIVDDVEESEKEVNTFSRVTMPL